MRTILHLLVFCLLASCAGVALAKDPCKHETGPGLGLCTAYCEATECDCSYDPDCVVPNANDVACRNILFSYDFTTGHALACGDVCPCIDPNGWTDPGPANIFNAFATPTVQADSCDDFGTVVRVEKFFPDFGPTWTATVTDTQCSISEDAVGSIFFADFNFTLTPQQAATCRNLLRDQQAACDD